MKFAQSLEDHMVPEWRAQYLDYKAGKKKLKKLSRKPSVLNSLKNTPRIASKTPASFTLNNARRYSDNPERLSNTPNTRKSYVNTPLLNVPEETQNESDNEDENENPNETITRKTSDTGTDALTLKDTHFEDQLTLESDASFALPAAALNVNDAVYGSTGPPSFSRETTRINPSKAKSLHDKTPLLTFNEHRPSGDSSNSINDGANDFNTLTRRQSLSALFDSFRRRPSVSPRVQDTELEDLASYARQQFVAWVDSELEKVNEFYSARENACVDRFLVLQDQVLQLELQKQESKKRYQHARRTLRNHRAASMDDIEADGDIEDDFDDDDDDDYGDDHGYDEFIHSGVLTLNNISMLDAAHRNFKLLSFWTRRKLRIINKFDMPSLPSFEWLKENGKIEKQYYEAGYYSDDDDYDDAESIISNNNVHQSEHVGTSTAHIRDFQRRKKDREAEIARRSVPYFVARRMIKKAVYELYRLMELLKSYRLMNRIAFRKLMKKYDKTTGDSMLTEYMKKVDDTYFSKSDVLDNLMTRVEEMYTRYFENGNRKVSVTKLRTSAVEKTYYMSDYFGGFFMGLALPFVVYSIYLGLYKTLTGELINGKYLLQIWGGFFVIVLMSCLFSINCLVWTKFKVNYKFIFEFNQHDTLDFKQYMLLPSLFLFFGGFTAWFSFQNFWPDIFSGYDFPWIFLGVSLAVILCPFDIFFLNARIWLLSTITRLLLSGFYPVEFRDFFLGDIFCSLTYSISNVSMFFCIYSKHWNNCSSCGSSESRLLGFLQCLPSIWRFLQCFRRYADTGDWFPHLANMGKYTVSTLYYMSLSLYRIETINKYKVLLIFWATLNSVYSSIWDIVMDWSLFQFDSKHFLLRDEITFKNPSVYYSAMVTDAILRFQWIFYVLFPAQIQQSAFTSFGIAIAEILRRFIWIFFRMENEHATNVHLFRASRESPLPYPAAKRKRNSPRFRHRDEETSRDLVDQDLRKRKGNKNDLESGTVRVSTPQTAYANTNNAHHQGNKSGPSTLIPNTFNTYPNVANVSPVTKSRQHAQNESGTNDGSKAYTTGAFASVSRYVQQLSQAMRNAHIKDFQRRKVTKKSVLQREEAEEEAEEEEEGLGEHED